MNFLQAWNAALTRYEDTPYLSQPGWAVRGSEAEARLRTYTAALMAHGLKPRDTLAFYGKGNAEWLMIQHAALRAGATIALLPAAADESILARLLDQAKPKYVLAATEDDGERVIRCMNTVRSIVQTIVQKGHIRNPRCVSWGPVLQSGELYEQEKGAAASEAAEQVRPDDIALIAFSAGTLGYPRSVAITHERIDKQVSAVAQRLKYGPALYAEGRFELLDHVALIWAGVMAGREIVFEAPPKRPYEWVSTAPALSNQIFSVTWPAVGPGALPRGFKRWRFDRQLAGYLKGNYPDLVGAHTGFSVPPASIRKQIAKAGMRLTWGYGLTEAHGYCAFEENGVGFGTVLPTSRLATHGGKLVFDFADRPTEWWQSTGDWARTVGPWINDLEPHGVERGEPGILHTARDVQREIADHPWIESAFVSGPEPMGDVALLSLRAHPVFAWAHAKGHGKLDWESLLSLPELIDPMLARVRAIGHRHGVRLQPRILKRGFSEATGELTARGELRRAVILRNSAQYLQAPRPVQ